MSENTNTVRDRVVPALLVAVLLALIALIVVVLVDAGEDSAATEEAPSGGATAAACRQFTLIEAEVSGLDGPLRAGNVSPTVLGTYEMASLELREVASVEGLDADVFDALADLTTGLTTARATFSDFADTGSNWVTVNKRLATLDRLATAVEFACEPHLS